MRECGDRVCEHGQGNLEYRCDDGNWSTYSRSIRLDIKEGRTDKCLVSAYYHVNLRARLLSDADARGTYGELQGYVLFWPTTNINRLQARGGKGAMGQDILPSLTKEMGREACKPPKSIIYV